MQWLEQGESSDLEKTASLKFGSIQMRMYKIRILKLRRTSHTTHHTTQITMMLPELRQLAMQAAASSDELLLIRQINRKAFTTHTAPVQVRPSRTHGLGVFATQAIPQEKVVTLYPCDSSVLYNTRREIIDVHSDSSTLLTDNDIIEAMKANQAYNIAALKGTVVINGDPAQHNNPWFIGHMCNDGACINESNKSDPKQLYRAAQVYTACSDAKANAYLHELSCYGRLYCMAIVTQKAVAAGEELLVSYGHQHWMTTAQWKEAVSSVEGDGNRS